MCGIAGVVHLDGEPVDVILVGADAGVFLFHFREALIPIRHRDRDAVGLGARGHVLAGALLRELERVLEDAVDTLAREGRDLLYDLAVGAFVHPPAEAGVFALGVLAHHVVVDVARLAAGERAGQAREKAHGAQVDVQVEPAAKVDQQSPHRDVVRHQRRVADRAEIDRVEFAQGLRRVLGAHLAVLLVPVAVPRERLELEVDAVLRPDRFEDAHALGHDLLAYAVAGDDCDGVLGHFRASVS